MFHLKYLLFLCLVSISFISKTQVDGKAKNIYMFPGQGSDERIFKNLVFDSARFNIIYIKYETPKKKDNLKSYALRLLNQIDTSKEFILIGVSLGGMIATEINEVFKAEKVIIISSAKCRIELPVQYKFQKTIAIYKIIPKRFFKRSAFIVQPIFEPDRKKEKETCVAMLKAKDPLFLKRTTGMIINWKRTEFDSTIIHIHGDKDHTIPIKNVKYNYLIKNGSHMMTLTQSDDINKILLELLKE